MRVSLVFFLSKPYLKSFYYLYFDESDRTLFLLESRTIYKLCKSEAPV